MWYLCAQDVKASLKEMVKQSHTDGIKTSFGSDSASMHPEMGLNLSFIVWLCVSMTCKYKYNLICLLAAIMHFAGYHETENLNFPLHPVKLNNYTEMV